MPPCSPPSRGGAVGHRPALRRGLPRRRRHRHARRPRTGRRWPQWPPTDLDAAAQLEILRAWAVLTLRSRMLAVIDVSGSMEEPAENGLRRIDIFQQAAIGAMEKFSGEVEMGVWVFSTARNGDIDYEDLSPIARSPTSRTSRRSPESSSPSRAARRRDRPLRLDLAAVAAGARVLRSREGELGAAHHRRPERGRERHRPRYPARRAREDGRSVEARAGHHDRLRPRHRPGRDAAHRPGDKGAAYSASGPRTSEPCSSTRSRSAPAARTAADAPDTIAT